MAIGFAVPTFDPQMDDDCFCGSGDSFGDCCGSKADKRRPPHGVTVMPRFLDPRTCAQWVKYLETRPRGKAQVLDLEQSSPGAPVYIQDRARVCDEVNADQLRPAINNAVALAFEQVSAGMDRKIAWFEIPRVLRYSPGGYYIRHADSCQVGEDSKTWYKVEDRDLSLLLYINDAFTGGGLSFTRFNCHYKPRIGDMLAFPSDNRYEHRADLVKSGFRYAIASWAAFEDEQRVRPNPPAGAIFMDEVMR
jgi:predicted 2-oxoglutarate/Fe(II)-dependent dioxygenase YbiX